MYLFTDIKFKEIILNSGLLGLNWDETAKLFFDVARGDIYLLKIGWPPLFYNMALNPLELMDRYLEHLKNIFYKVHDFEKRLNFTRTWGKYNNNFRRLTRRLTQLNSLSSASKYIPKSFIRLSPSWKKNSIEKKFDKHFFL